MAIETTSGDVVEALEQPRASFAGHALETPWTTLQLAYFVGTAMWTYLTQPFTFGFASVPAVVVPAITREQQLAEKLHACTRDYGRQENGRAKDLYDMLVIAQQLPLPGRDELAGACRQTFELRRTAWPPVLRPPPRSWDMPWRTFTANYGIQVTSLDSAYDALVRFWQPVFAGSVTTWNADRWAWS